MFACVGTCHMRRGRCLFKQDFGRISNNDTEGKQEVSVVPREYRGFGDVYTPECSGYNRRFFLRAPSFTRNP